MKEKNKKTDAFALKFAELMIKKMESIQEDWKCPWLPVKKKNFFPRNISGRKYNGTNRFMLLLYSFFLDFQTPVFLTYKQAKQLELDFKGASFFPVIHYSYSVIHRETKERIPYSEYCKLPEKEQDEYQVYSNVKYYNVVNLSQTNYSKLYSEEWDQLLAFYNEKKEAIGNNFHNNILDEMLSEEQWVCPIHIQSSNKAYYTPTNDYIVCPLKNQFEEGEAFYSTLLHEMSHSTGHPDRLDRLKAGSFGDYEYAKEELVAELSSAMVSYLLGISTTIRQENATYLKGWMKTMKEKPEFLMNTLSAATKVVDFMTDKLSLKHLDEDSCSFPTLINEPEIANA